METKHPPQSIKIAAALTVLMPFFGFGLVYLQHDERLLAMQAANLTWINFAFVTLFTALFAWGFYRGKNWARTIYLIFAVLGTLMTLGLRRLHPDLIPLQNTLFGLISTVVIVYFLLKSESGQWFKDNASTVQRSLFVRVLIWIGIILGILLLFILVVGGIVAYKSLDVYKHKDQLIAETSYAKNQGAILGQSSTGKQCFDATMEGLKTSFAKNVVPVVSARFFLESCLSASTNSEDFCALGPNSYEIMAESMWSIKTAQQYGIDPNAMSSLRQVFESRCAKKAP